jgi:hypothetical protein
MHVFSGSFVPPYLAKTILPWPFYYLANTGWIVSFFRWYYGLKYRRDFANAKTQKEEQSLWERIYADRIRARKRADFKLFVANRPYLNVPYKLLLFWISLIAALYVFDFVDDIFKLKGIVFDWINEFENILSSFYLYYDLNGYLKFTWVLLILLFVKWGRRFIFSMVSIAVPFLKKIISKELLHLLERYYLMGRFAFYNSQEMIARRALHQLPPGSAIVMLPMDMEYMGAGKTKMCRRILATMEKNIAKKDWKKEDYKDVYKYQMRELWQFVEKGKTGRRKDKYYPFVFIDPRRYEEEGTDFFDYEIVSGKMKLKDCFIKTYIEDRGFCGFKIYPALGYYPFDEKLLPIWRYAAENKIPITAHCIIGTIYYRGEKKKEWNYHPVFQDKLGEDDYRPMLLPQLKNVNFQNNFTHPLNYLCLLEERFFKEVLRNTDADSEVRKLFGYSEEEDTLQNNLSSLKICLGHYGGEEEWIRYLEQDRENYSQRLMRDPLDAIKFMENSRDEFSWPKINDLWEKADWYSLICSMMIKYENVYADLSYIISKKSIYPLLKYTLEKGENYAKEHKAYLQEENVHKKGSHYTGKNKLRSRVLFGTDFYVVRNHKSDKDLFIETKALLDEESFDLIARENTHNFLARS